MIKLYSTNCPVCKQIKASLDSKNIQYEYITDIDIILEIADKNNITTAPFAEIDGKIFDSTQLKSYINTL